MAPVLKRAAFRDGGYGAHSAVGIAKSRLSCTFMQMPVTSPADEVLSGPLLSAHSRCLLEAGFPFAELAELTRADRVLSDPVYAAHKWWARRPRSVIRALILAAHLPSTTSAGDFWSMFANDGYLLDGMHVGDPFSGGGTTLVEAARLGASATGTDVDPLAVRIARDELATVDDDLVTAVANDLLEHLRDKLGHLYPASTPGTQPLHYFRLRRACCPDCDTESLLYRTPVLARDVGRAGGVVRDGKQVVVCPCCRGIRGIGAEATTFVCCHRRWQLSKGTFSRSGFTCPSCSGRHSLEKLTAGSLPEELIAVEDTVIDGRRRLRAPTDEDLAAVAAAHSSRATMPTNIPADALDGVDGGRPRSYGFQTVADLFGDRQLAVISTALDWLRDADIDSGARARVELAISNAIASNNRLCGYATDYGRLAPAFTGVRSYSLPILSVELNPLHPTAGRGTLAATLRRLERSSQGRVRRSVRVGDGVEPREMAAKRAVAHLVACRSADQRFPTELGPCSAVITDPPYYDFIAYSDLSLLHRAWLQAGTTDQMGGTPIFPTGPDGHATFAKRLGRALRNSSRSLLADGVLAFTYHSSHELAWDALASAVADAGMTVTAVFPVWADARSSVAHGHPGSCEWDLVWVCRPGTVHPPCLPSTTEGWDDAIPDLCPADRVSMRLGLAAAQRANRPG